MRDRDVRAPLIRELVRTYKADLDTLIVDEFGLCQGDARVDVAVINGALNGFEIKSDSDTLDRLPAQQAVYSKVLDSVTIIAGEKHVDAILKVVPGWWAVRAATQKKGRVYFSVAREGQRNQGVDPFAVVQLLWRSEALHLIERLGLGSKLSRRPRRELWQLLVENLSVAELGAHVRRQIKGRANWRSAT